MTNSQKLTKTGTFLVSFAVADEEAFGFQPCQFVAIDCESRGWGYRRSPYCIFSPPNKKRTFQLLVRRIPTGPVSMFICDLRVGDVISFRGPTGPSMVPAEPGTELILIATGVGVSPFHSLLHHLLPNGFQRTIRLYWGLRLREDICLIEPLEELQARFPNFTYHISLSQPGNGWQGLRGRVTESVPPLLETLQNKHFYLCGNGAMIADLSAALSELGIPKSLLFEEYFFNFHHAPDRSTLSKVCSRFVARDVVSPYERARAVWDSL